MLLLTKVWHSISQTQHDVLNIYGSLKKLLQVWDSIDWTGVANLLWEETGMMEKHLWLDYKFMKLWNGERFIVGR